MQSSEVAPNPGREFVGSSGRSFALSIDAEGIDVFLGAGSVECATRNETTRAAVTVLGAWRLPSRRPLGAARVDGTLRSCELRTRDALPAPTSPLPARNQH
jgi:hypothetical protein